ncbi:hypothetical protein FRB98_001056, partial [Tulasnella sp. 332]
MPLLQTPAAEELFDAIFLNTMSNFIQTITAADNPDIGNPCPSFMTQPSMAADVLYSTSKPAGRHGFSTLSDTPAAAYKTFINM